MKNKFNVAFTGIVESNDVAGRVTISGEIVSIKAVDVATHPDQTGDAQVVTIQNVAGDHPIWLADNMIDSFQIGSVLFEGNVVSIVADKRIAGETSFVNRTNGQNEPHKKDGFGAISVNHGGKSVMNMLGLDKSDKASVIAERTAMLLKYVPKAPKVVFNPASVDMTSKESITAKIADYTVKMAVASPANKLGFQARIQQLEQQLLVLTVKPETAKERTAREKAEAEGK
jgi:hypothetical protein